MDVLDNEGEEEAPPKPTLPTKQQSPVNNTSLHQKTAQNYSSNSNYQSPTNLNQVYSQKEVPISNIQAQVASFSAKNILSTKQNEGQYPTSNR